MILSVKTATDLIIIVLANVGINIRECVPVVANDGADQM
jgi:hypothetical protein